MESESSYSECLLCCVSMRDHAITSCQHTAQICVTCILRLHRFGKKDAAQPHMSCPYCKQSWTTILVTAEASNRQNALLREPVSAAGWRDQSLNWIYDESLGMHFENARIRDRYRMMCSWYCVLCIDPMRARARDVHASFSTATDLARHMQHKHNRFMCSACMQTRHVFAGEHQVFTRRELTDHFRHGTNKRTRTEYQLPVTCGTIEPHPFCPFCNEPYFTRDELYAHLLANHVPCQFCTSAESQHFYRCDDRLREHFHHRHFVCDDSDCAGRIPVVFPDALGLRAHKLASHSHKLTKAEVRQLQTIPRGASSSTPTSASSLSAHPFAYKVCFVEAPPPQTASPTAWSREDDFPALGGASSRTSYA